MDLNTHNFNCGPYNFKLSGYGFHKEGFGPYHIVHKLPYKNYKIEINVYVYGEDSLFICHIPAMNDTYEQLFYGVCDGYGYQKLVSMNCSIILPQIIIRDLHKNIFNTSEESIKKLINSCVDNWDDELYNSSINDCCDAGVYITVNWKLWDGNNLIDTVFNVGDCCNYSVKDDVLRIRTLSHSCENYKELENWYNDYYKDEEELRWKSIPIINRFNLPSQIQVPGFDKHISAIDVKKIDNQWKILPIEDEESDLHRFFDSENIIINSIKKNKGCKSIDKTFNFQNALDVYEKTHKTPPNFNLGNTLLGHIECFSTFGNMNFKKVLKLSNKPHITSEKYSGDTFEFISSPSFYNFIRKDNIVNSQNHITIINEVNNNIENYKTPMNENFHINDNRVVWFVNIQQVSDQCHLIQE